MYLCIWLIAVGLTNVKAKSLLEVDHIGNVSSATDFFKESEIPSDHKCDGLCSENLQKVDTQCKEGQGLVPKYYFNDPYCKDCECRNGNNCSFVRMFNGAVIKTCECEAGYEEMKGVCIGTCKDNPCQNEGECAIDGQDIECNCKASFTGFRCEINLELPNKQTLGTTSGILQTTIATTDLRDTETATPDLQGTETGITNTPDTESTTVIIDLCVIKPCKNGGICKMEDEKYVCYCPSPFTGKYCEMDPCSNNPCRNGGTCFIDGTGFQCICREPFAGDTCEASPCMWNPCKNGGICKLVNNSARCFCDNPYSGEFCEYVKGTALTLIMLLVISSLLVIILVLLSCTLCQRMRGPKSS